MRSFQSCPPSSRAKAWPFGSATSSAGVSMGTSETLMRSSLRDLKSTPEVGSEESSTPETLIRVKTSTRGGWSVSISAVANSFTRSMIIVLKLPATCPALARLPMRASTSDQVWV